MRACQAIRTVAHGPVTRRFAVAAPAPYLWARPALACRVPPAGAGCPRRFFSAEKKEGEEEAKSGCAALAPSRRVRVVYHRDCCG
jgi:hypothetical protein